MRCLLSALSHVDHHELVGISQARSTLIGPAGTVAWNSAAGLTMHVTLLAAALPLVLLLSDRTTLAGAYAATVTPPFDKQQLQKQVRAQP